MNARGPAAIQREGQEVLVIKHVKAEKRCEESAHRVWIHGARRLSADLQGSARKVATVAFFTFSSPRPRAVHYMQLEECRRGAAKRERVFMNAHERGGGPGWEEEEEERGGGRVGGRKEAKEPFFVCNLTRGEQRAARQCEVLHTGAAVFY